jgi:hypothetical protein
MAKLTYADVVPEILATIKGLRFPPDFDHYDLSYIVVEGHLMQHLISDDVSPEDIDAAFALMQRMVESDDEDVLTLLSVGIIESFEAWATTGEPGLERLLTRVPPPLDDALRREFPGRWPGATVS